MFILNVKVDRIDLSQAVELVESWLKQSKKRYIVTPNLEMVMLAQKDQEFKKILNRADLAICDGAGLRLADRNLIRVSGRDLMLELIKRGHKTALVGGAPGIAEKTAETLKRLFVGLPTKSLFVGLSEPDVSAINRIKPDLLFVALGHAKQEKWIAKNLPRLKVKVAMGVGGALDQIVKPWLVAPRFIQALGLEWLYRLTFQPWRIKRQLVLAKFIWKLLTD